MRQPAWVHRKHRPRAGRVEHLPAIAEVAEIDGVATPAGPCRCSRRAAEALQPAREPLSMLAEIESTIGECSLGSEPTGIARNPGTAADIKRRRRGAAASSTSSGSGAICPMSRRNSSGRGV